MSVQPNATGRNRAVCGPVPRWAIVTTIAGTALILLGALSASFTALADLAERAGIEGGQAWGWVLPVASAAIWAVPSPLVLLAITHSTVEQPSHTRTGPRGERSSDARVASWAVAVSGTSRQQRRETAWQWRQAGWSYKQSARHNSVEHPIHAQGADDER